MRLSWQRCLAVLLLCAHSGLQGIFSAIASKQYGEEKFLSGLVAEVWSVRPACLTASR